MCTYTPWLTLHTPNPPSQKCMDLAQNCMCSFHTPSCTRGHNPAYERPVPANHIPLRAHLQNPCDCSAAAIGGSLCVL